MLFFENLFLAFSSLKSNKMRSLLTMLGIIIGIGSVIAIVTVGNSLTNSITSSMDSLGANNISVGLQQKSTEEETTDSGMTFKGPNRQKQPTEDDYFTDEMIEEFVKKYSGSINGISISEGLGNGKVSMGDSYANVSVTGGNRDYFNSQDLTMLAGRELTDKALSSGKGVCLVSDYFVNNLFDGEAQNAIGKSVEIEMNDNGFKYYVYTIVGVYEYSSQMLMSASEYDIPTDMYVPLLSVQSKNHTLGKHSDFTVITKPDVDNDTFRNKIESFFDFYYHNNDFFKVSTFSYAQIVSSFTDILSKVSLAIEVIAAISLLVGGIGVMNIMLVSISERTKEIGTRKALGATNGSIRLQFIIEAIVLCLVGGIIGIIIGILGGAVGAKALGYDAAPSVSSIIFSLVFSMVIGVFFGYYPANKAAKMNPIDALRYE